MEHAIYDTLMSRSKITQAGAGVSNVSKSNIEVTVEKDHVELLRNKTIERMNVKLNLDLDSITNPAEDVELWVRPC